MKLRTAIAITATASMLTIPVAIAQMPGMDMQKMMQMMMPKPDDSASTKDFKKAHIDMMQNMNMEFSGNAVLILLVA